MTEETRLYNKVDQSANQAIRNQEHIEALEKRVDMLYKILGAIALLVVGLVVDYFKG